MHKGRRRRSVWLSVCALGTGSAGRRHGVVSGKAKALAEGLALNNGAHPQLSDRTPSNTHSSALWDLVGLGARRAGRSGHQISRKALIIVLVLLLFYFFKQNVHWVVLVVFLFFVFLIMSCTLSRRPYTLTQLTLKKKCYLY